MRLRALDAANYIRELRRRLDRPRRNDRSRDRSRLRLFSVFAKNFRQGCLVQSVHQIGCAGAVRPHAHIQRRLEPKREASARIIKLHRGDAEVSEKSADRVEV